MIITKVSAQKRPGRYNIFIDGKYAFSAGEKTLAEFVLLKGKELNDEQVEKIRQFDADAKASDLAAHFLSYEPRTIFEVLHIFMKGNYFLVLMLVLILLVILFMIKILKQTIRKEQLL